MARKSRTAVLKRQREVRKAEKAALKREKRGLRDENRSTGAQVATADDLAGYGFNPQPGDDDAAPPPVCGPAGTRQWLRSR